MADLVSLIVPSPRITLESDTSIEYDKDVRDGHIMAGFGALTLVGNAQVKLSEAGDPVHYCLILVEPDGKVVATYAGYGVFVGGDEGTPAIRDRIMGDVVTIGSDTLNGAVTTLVAANVADVIDHLSAPRVDNVRPDSDLIGETVVDLVDCKI